ncbi:MAG: hypothetical protein DPW16_11695 [Chloroflexi bacterium]|nr:hypothetical protein [Chloroflexota bacterium]
MSNIVIGEPLASRLRALAEQKHQALEEFLETLIEASEKDALPPPYNPDYPSRPAESLTDDDIDLPDKVEDVEAYRAAVRAMRPKLYEKARRYWQKMGDTDKLALTDEQLDKVFWLIDAEGIPRFKSEKGTIVIPPDPFDDIMGIFDDDISDLSSTVNESVAEYFRQKHDRTD